jgi:hypothetical protein
MSTRQRKKFVDREARKRRVDFGCSLAVI